MKSFKADYTAYNDSNVSGAVRALGKFFNIAASEGLTLWSVDHILRDGFETLKNTSAKPIEQPIRLSKIDEVHLRISFMEVAAKLSGVRTLGDSHIENMAHVSCEIFDKAVKLGMIKPAV